MLHPLDSDANINDTLKKIESFEATSSRANIGTGARREGEEFQHLAKELWNYFRQLAERNGAQSEIVIAPDKRKYARLSVENRILFIPVPTNIPVSANTSNKLEWLEVTFPVQSLIANFPGEGEVIRYAPTEGEYSGSNYPEIYKGMNTEFDDTIVLVKNGTLYEKILIEYKTAKSSRKDRIDGNAHERLTFQIMQYLEVASLYTRCSLFVMTNSAFVQYKNKYHVNFHVQAERLGIFSQFDMTYACTIKEYKQFLNSLLSWLLEDEERPQRPNVPKRNIK